MPTPDILIVEDEAGQREMLRAFLEGHALVVATAGSVAEAHDALAAAPPRLLLTDFDLPDGNGIEVLRAARADDPALPAIVITAYGTVPMAVEAMRQGAVDVQLKPVDPQALLAQVRRALGIRAMAEENDDLRARLAARAPDAGMVAESPLLRDLLATVDRIAPTQATVLITGESGTGKELVARRVHERSRRAEGAFVATHCAALPESLLETELFGHVRGAFTGAIADRLGRFEQADGGTLFLDEIGELPPSVQVRLLRVLQEREITRVGENQVRAVDVRVVAATHRDLEVEVAAGRFREDLFYRLNVMHVHLPALRDRPEDVPVLVARFVREAADRHGLAPMAFADETLDALVHYAFPGNVRELRNVVERALLLATGARVEVSDLPPLRRPSASGEASNEPTSLEEAVEALERSWIERALEGSAGVQTRAADALGIPERVLRYKMKKYGIAKPPRS